MVGVISFLALVSAVSAIIVPVVDRSLIFPSQLFPYCHACTLAELKDGTVLAAFHAGSHEDADDVSIYVARRNASDGSWSTPQHVAPLDGHCRMNPSMYVNDNDDVFIDFHFGDIIGSGECDTDDWHGAYVKSVDSGSSWSPVIDLPVPFLGGIKNKCIRTSSGAVLCPASTEAVDNTTELWLSHIETTDQNYHNWTSSNNISFRVCTDFGAGVIQPSLFEVRPGKIVALMRSGCGMIARSVSNDNGKTFSSPAEPTSLANPDAGIDGVLMDGSPDLGMLLVFNNSTRSRNPLTIAHSTDEGITWSHIMDLENAPDGRYEYPGVISSHTQARTAMTCYSHTEGGVRVMAFAKMTFPVEA
jgi:predicted neuraminidase